MPFPRGLERQLCAGYSHLENEVRGFYAVVVTSLCIIERLVPWLNQ